MWWRVAAGCLALIAGGPACGQAASARATLLAPEAVRPLLEAHFDATVPAPVDGAARAAFLRRAQREVGELLAAEGWFSPAIGLRPAQSEDVVLEVVPGRRTTVARVDLEFRGDLAGGGEDKAQRVEGLRDAWKLEVGEAFRSAAWEEAKAALLAGVARRDYAAAAIVDSRADVDPAAATAVLNVVVDSGPALRFGEFVITGLERYDEELVRNQAPFRPGDPYRRDQLLDFQARLQGISSFGSVIVGVDAAAARDGALPVRVALAEAKSRQVGFAIGYSSNNGARGEINYRDYNFFGHAWRLTSLLRLEQNQQTLGASVDTYPDENGYRLAWTGRVEATNIQGLRTLRQTLGAARLRTRGRMDTRLGIDWQREERRPSGGIQETDQALVLDGRWTLRDVDDPLFPRRGDLVDVRVGGARRELLSDQDFLRTHVRYQRWWPIGARDVLAMRAEAGYTAAPSRFGIPQEYLFRAGGAQSVRGYAYQSLGVREGEAIVGGRTMLTGSLEYTHWFTRDWGGALFADAGNAADTWGDLHAAVGAGAGVRWRSPAGPLGLDVAYGREVRKWRVDFSISVGF